MKRRLSCFFRRCQDNERRSWLDFLALQAILAFQRLGAHAVSPGDGKQGIALAYLVSLGCRPRIGAGEARLGNGQGWIARLGVAIAGHQQGESGLEPDTPPNAIDRLEVGDSHAETRGDFFQAVAGAQGIRLPGREGFLVLLMRLWHSLRLQD